jgi:hypothetical protein
VHLLRNSANTNYSFECIPSARPHQWLYLFGAEGVVYSEAHNRFAGLDAAGVSAYRAFDAGANVEDLRSQSNVPSMASTPAADALDVIHALSQGIFPDEDASADWPAFDPTSNAKLGIANIEIHGIAISLDYPLGPLEHLCRDYFQNCAPTNQPSRCNLSVRPVQEGWAIFVNGHKFFSLQRKEQVGLGLMHAARSLLYAKGGYDIAFHAAMVAHGDCGVMLCAPREYGKSTLVAHLLTLGFGLLTDEPALLDLDTCSVASLRLPLSLKQGSWSLLRSEWPQLTNAPIHVRSDGIGVRLAHAPTERFCDRPHRLTHIVFPQYCPHSTTQVESLLPMQTLSLLNEGGMSLAKHLTHDNFDTFIRLVCQTPAYRFRYTSFEDVQRILPEFNFLKTT